jgi:nucleoid-associated protein YgaU
MAQALEKLKIKNEDTGEEFSVLFNPTEYSIDDASTWSDQDRMGQKPELQYTGGARKKLSMELFFDTHESKSDVREHTGKIAGLLEFNSDAHRPPKVTLSWGKEPPAGVPQEFPFTAVLESLKQQFILFMSDGTPVRAKLSVSFVQFTLPEEELKKNDPSSPDHTKTYLVKTGDTISGIAGLFYKKPRWWRYIARANDIVNPRQLEPGQMLVIPRIEPGEKG